MTFINFIEEYTHQVIASGILILSIITLRIISAKGIIRYAKNHSNIEHRSNLVIKYINLLLNIIGFISLLIIWGVQKKDLFFTVSSVATVIGVAMFAQWSILSNVTSGIILFFFYPFKIGDTIKIHDKDFPVQGVIEDINAFHLDLVTKDGEHITYPNNLILQKGISIIKFEKDDREFMD